MSALEAAMAHAATLLDAKPEAIVVFTFTHERGIEASVCADAPLHALLLARALAGTAGVLIEQMLRLPGASIEHHDNWHPPKSAL